MQEPEDLPTFEKVASGPERLDEESIKAIVEKEFRVYEVDRDTRGLGVAQLLAFYVMADAETFDKRFEAVRDAIHMLDERLLVVLQHRLGEDVIMVARRPPVQYGKGHLNVFLLVATFLTTTLAGSFFWVGYKKLDDLLFIGSFDASALHFVPLLWGFVTFGLPLMTILGIHELGHWFVARRHKVRTSLPYFIPVPPPLLFGTFGAFIAMKEPMPDRKALFDVGASGPIAGFIVTLPVLILGLVLTAVVAEPLPAQPEIHAQLVAPDGTTWGYDAQEEGWTSMWVSEGQINTWTEHLSLPNTTEGFVADALWTARFPILHLDHNGTIAYNATITAGPADAARTLHLAGTLNATLADINSSREIRFHVPADATLVNLTLMWQPPPSGLIALGDSLTFVALSWIVDQVTSAPEDVFIHPTALAGWVGLLVTGFNLLPAGQLDGGHIARALLGDKMRYLSYASVAMMMILSYLFAGWFILALLVLMLGVRHPPPLNDRTELDDRRKLLGFAVALVLVLSFVPIPLQTLP